MTYLKTGDKVVSRDTRGSIQHLLIHDGGSSQGRRPERGGETVAAPWLVVSGVVPAVFVAALALPLDDPALLMALVLALRGGQMLLDIEPAVAQTPGYPPLIPEAVAGGASSAQSWSSMIDLTPATAWRVRSRRRGSTYARPPRGAKLYGWRGFRRMS